MIILHNCASLATGIGNLAGYELDVPTALEMTFTIPVDVPGDRTEVAIDCSATDNAGAAAQLANDVTWAGVVYGAATDTNDEFNFNDPLKIY